MRERSRTQTQYTKIVPERKGFLGKNSNNVLFFVFLFLLFVVAGFFFSAAAVERLCFFCHIDNDMSRQTLCDIYFLLASRSPLWLWPVSRFTCLCLGLFLIHFDFSLFAVSCFAPISVSSIWDGYAADAHARARTHTRLRDNSLNTYDCLCAHCRTAEIHRLVALFADGHHFTDAEEASKP